MKVPAVRRGLPAYKGTSSALAEYHPADIIDKVLHIEAWMLGEFEQIVLLAIMREGDDAYGVTIRRAIVERSGRDVSLAAVYKTLTRLEEKGLVAVTVGEPTPERGGRRKRYYAVTTAGRSSLRQSVEVLRRMARGLDLGLETP
jgi:DNA-binding PadR family transcriptional regulator